MASQEPEPHPEPAVTGTLQANTGRMPIPLYGSDETGSGSSDDVYEVADPTQADQCCSHYDFCPFVPEAAARTRDAAVQTDYTVWLAPQGTTFSPVRLRPQKASPILALEVLEKPAFPAIPPSWAVFPALPPEHGSVPP